MNQLVYFAVEVDLYTYTGVEKNDNGKNSHRNMDLECGSLYFMSLSPRSKFLQSPLIHFVHNQSKSLFDCHVQLAYMP